MDANNKDRMSGAVDQEAFETAIRENLSPEGVVAVVAFLRVGDSYHPASAEGQRAMREVEWLANTLLEMVGVDEYNHLLDELGL
jgi:hypothetical protein